MLERLFGINRQGSTVATEARAALVTFLTLSYILLVNPQILSQTGMPAADIAVATALAAGLATLLMGLWANYPFALAPGMGLNAFFAYLTQHLTRLQGQFFLLAANKGDHVVQRIKGRHAWVAGARQSLHCSDQNRA